MKVLVTGATGAIGKALIAALPSGCEVVPVSRHPVQKGLQADFVEVPSRSWWADHLDGVDVVVNAAGIIRENRKDSFLAVHQQAPIELFHGCVAAGVAHVIQISALGADEGAVSLFHLTKKAADDALRSLPIASTIVQPSLVYGPGVASAALFNRLAVLPWLALPRGGQSIVQPVTLEDVIEGLVALVVKPAAGTQTVAFVGPEPLTVRHYLELLRDRQGFGRRQHVVGLADSVSLALAGLMESHSRSLFTREAVAMLLRGNTAPAGPFAQLLGRPPRSMAVRAEGGEDLANLDEAMLALWLGPLRGAVALLWIWTGMVSLGLYPPAESLALLASVGVTGALAPWILYGAAFIDLALGLAVWLTRGGARRWVWLAQLIIMAGYTAILSGAAPRWWLHPFGPLSKNLPLAVLIGFLWAIECRTDAHRASPSPP